MAPLAKKVKLVGATTLHGYLYIVGGIEFTTELGWRCCGTTQKYDPATNSWTPAALLNSHRSSVCLVSDANYLYSIDRLADDDFLSCNERYDPKLNMWTKMASMKEKCGCACGVYLSNKIYISGGTVDAFSRHASVSGEVYDIALDEWHAIASMHVPRFHASAILLQDCIFGGFCVWWHWK